MKKIISALLAALMFISVFATTSLAYLEKPLDEEKYNHAFLYEVDGMMFLSSEETVSELIENGSATIYLPTQVKGKNISVHMIAYRHGRSCGAIDPMPSTSFSIRYNIDTEKEYVHYINFVHSDDAQFDYAHQIGTSDYFSYLGYYSNSERIVFISQDEMDTLVSTGHLNINDENLWVYDDVDFVLHTSATNKPCGGKMGTDNPLVNRLELEYDFEYGDITHFEFFVNEKATIFDPHCLIGIIWNVLMDFFKENFIR